MSRFLTRATTSTPHDTPPYQTPPAAAAQRTSSAACRRAPPLPRAAARLVHSLWSWGLLRGGLVPGASLYIYIYGRFGSKSDFWGSLAEWSSARSKSKPKICWSTPEFRGPSRFLKKFLSVFEARVLDGHHQAEDVCRGRG